MTVQCPSCQATLSVPDERLPKGKVVQATCPRCKGLIPIDLGAAPAPSTPPAPSEVWNYDERRQPRALVCIEAPDERAQVLATLKEAGFQARAAADAAEALEQLRFTPHAVAVIRDGFGAAGGGALLDVLAEMGAGMRRHLSVVLVSDDLPALDPMAAFARSVDVIIHPRGLAHLADVLQSCAGDGERKYRVLLDTVRAVGKA